MKTYPTMQTTAHAAQIIENKLNQETDKLRSRVADLVRLRADADQPNYARLKAEIVDLRDCIQIMDDAKATLAVAFTTILAAE